MQGRFTDARRLMSASRAGMESLGTGLHRAAAELYGGAQPATLADDLEEAERAARKAVSHTVEVAESWYQAFAWLRLARILCLQGRPDEGLRILDESERLPSPPDLEIVVGQPTVWLARGPGRLAEARLSPARQSATPTTGFSTAPGRAASRTSCTDRGTPRRP
jgi:ATP/maltotriose-dependent transcriptional regulator MalT